MTDETRHNPASDVLTVKQLRQALEGLPEDHDDMVVVVGHNEPSCCHHTYEGLKVLVRNFSPHYYEAKANRQAQVLQIATEDMDEEIQHDRHHAPILEKEPND